MTELVVNCLNRGNRIDNRVTGLTMESEKTAKMALSASPGVITNSTLNYHI